MSYAADRRNLLKFLAASPLFIQSALAEGLRWPAPMAWAPHDPGTLISEQTQAIAVSDSEPVMIVAVPPPRSVPTAPRPAAQDTSRPTRRMACGARGWSGRQGDGGNPCRPLLRGRRGRRNSLRSVYRVLPALNGRRIMFMSTRCRKTTTEKS